jgi:hypothetical protein
MLRIQRFEEEGFATFALSGRIGERRVPELQNLLEAEIEGVGITFDLEELRLVDREAVRFLASCEAGGIKLKNCPSYIREWIETGSETSHEERC